MPKRVFCKFFAQGACLKGGQCEFSHDWNDQTNNICTYYQKGACSYGARCKYEHVKASRLVNSVPSSSDSVKAVRHHGTQNVGPSSKSSSSVKLSASSKPFLIYEKPAWSSVPEDHSLPDAIDHSNVSPRDQPICSFAAAGRCLNEETCSYIHGELCSTCGKHCLHPFRPEEREDHRKLCENNHKRLEALRYSQEIECSVCLDRVLSKPTPAERKFGILSECDHPFCISCIRNWRSNSPATGMDINSALRACPICRKLSYFVIPSVIWYASREEKQEIIDTYKAKLRSIDCRYFDFGNGNCPFGTSCFYKHVIKPQIYRSDIYWPHSSRPWDADMDAIYTLFEHLYRPHCCVPYTFFDRELGTDSDSDDDLEADGYFDYDDFCNPYNHEDPDDFAEFLGATLLLSELGLGPLNSSDEDE